MPDAFGLTISNFKPLPVFTFFAFFAMINNLRVNDKCLQTPACSDKVIFYVDSLVPIISLHTPGTVLCVGLVPMISGGLLV